MSLQLLLGSYALDLTLIFMVDLETTMSFTRNVTRILIYTNIEEKMWALCWLWKL